MKNKRLVLSIIIALCLISVSLVGVTFAKYFTILEGGFDLSVLFRRYEEIDSRYEYTETYTLDENGNLTIKDIYYNESEGKWYRVKGIAEKGFSSETNTGCEGITNVSISKTVKSIGANAFTGLQELKTITVADGNTAFKVDKNGVLFSADGKTLVRYPSLKTGNYYTVPSTVTSIIAGAFSENSYCTAIVTDLYNETAWGSPSAVMINTSEFLDEITNITGDVESGYTVYLKNAQSGESIVLQGNDDPDNITYGNPKEVYVSANTSGNSFVTIESALCPPCEQHDHYAQIYLSSWKKLTYAYLTNENVLEIHNCLTAIVGGEIYQWVSNDKDDHRVLPNDTLYNIPSGTVSGSNKLPTTFPNWTDKKAEVLKVKVVDEIAPTSVSGWFSSMEICTEMDLAKLDTQNVTSMKQMFYHCYKLKELDLSHFDTSKVTSMYWMFMHCNALGTLNIFGFNTSSVTDMEAMFSYCYVLTSLDVSSFDTQNVTNMQSMFIDCRLLQSLDLTNFNTSAVKNMAYMFKRNYALSSLDVSSFNTAKVTTMCEMFTDCDLLTSLDLSSFDTSKVTDMGYMFAGSADLVTIYVSDKFVTTKVTNSGNMFKDCATLVGGNGTTLATVQATGVTATNSYRAKYAKIDKEGQLGYFTCGHTTMINVTNNGDGTHSGTCDYCEQSVMSRKHIYVDGICTSCSDQCSHESLFVHKPNADGTAHTAICKVCRITVTENHTYTDGKCICGKEVEPAA